MSFSVRLCGPPVFEAGGLEVRPLRHKTIALVAYLVAEGRPKGRDTLATLLWPSSGQAAARTNLRTAIHDAARILPQSMLAAGTDRIELLPCSEVWVDYWEVLRFFDNARDTTIERLTEANELFRGDFLEGFSLPDCSEFDLWQLQAADCLRRRQLQILSLLVVERMKIGAVSETLDDAARLVALDPFEEASHRLAMEAYARCGRWAMALEQFEACRSILRDELGAEPEPETVRFAEEVRRHNRRLFKPTAPVPLPDHCGGSPPIPTTCFFGRESELEHIDNLVQSGHRLITIVGPAGAGKSRLALEATARCMSIFPDGVVFAKLTDTRSPEDVPRIIAATIGIQQRVSGGDELLQSISSHLTGRRMLLLLDNFEHVVSAAPDLGRIIVSSRAVQFMVTSRQPLHIAGEVVVRLAPLDVPARGTIEEISACPAVRLFVDRARSQFPRLEDELQDVEAVRSVCASLDGLPLAIELAVPLLSVYSLRELPDRLSRPLDYLDGGGRDVPQRHRSLASAIEWSFSLLATEEKRTLCRLSVLENGFDMAAVEAVCESPDFQTVRMSIGGLLDKSLLLLACEKPVRRFALLEATREFVESRLDGANELQYVRERHAAHYCGLVLAAAEELHKREQMRWLEILDASHPNILQALGFLYSSGQFVRGLEAATALEWYWYRRGLYRLGAEQLERFLEQTSESTSVLRATALHSLGWLVFLSGDWRAAHYLYAQSLHLSRQLGDRVSEQLALSDLGVAERWLGDIESGSRYARAGVEVARMSGNEHSLARALVWAYATTGGRFADIYPLPELEEAAAVAQKIGDLWLVAHAHNGMGDLCCENGHFVEARAHYSLALDGFLELDDRYLAAWTLEGMGRLEERRGDVRCALTHISQVLLLFDSLGDDLNIALMIAKVVGLLGELAESSKRAVLAGAADGLLAAHAGEELALTPQVAEAQSYTVGLKRDYPHQWHEGSTLARATAVTRARELIESSSLRST